MTPFELAAFCGLERAAALLLPFCAAAIPHPAGMTELWIASASRLPESQKLEAVRLQLAKRRSANSIWRKATPLMMAVGHAAHFHVADRLIEAGADPNEGTSILHASCDWHFAHLIPALCYLSKAGWNVNARDSSGQSALHKAAFLGYTSAVRTLAGLGADPMVKDTLGFTPLDLARRWNKTGVVKLLERAKLTQPWFQSTSASSRSE